MQQAPAYHSAGRACLATQAQVLLACIYRRHRVVLTEPDEPWAFFPLARPKASE